jgi:hypothetical protein
MQLIIRSLSFSYVLRISIRSQGSLWALVMQFYGAMKRGLRKQMNDVEVHINNGFHRIILLVTFFSFVSYICSDNGGP